MWKSVIQCKNDCCQSGFLAMLMLLFSSCSCQQLIHCYFLEGSVEELIYLYCTFTVYCDKHMSIKFVSF